MEALRFSPDTGRKHSSGDEHRADRGRADVGAVFRPRFQDPQMGGRRRPAGTGGDHVQVEGLAAGDRRSRRRAIFFLRFRLASGMHVYAHIKNAGPKTWRAPHERNQFLHHDGPAFSSRPGDRHAGALSACVPAARKAFGAALLDLRRLPGGDRRTILVTRAGESPPPCLPAREGEMKLRKCSKRPADKAPARLSSE